MTTELILYSVTAVFGSTLIVDVLSNFCLFKVYETLASKTHFDELPF